MRDFRVPGCQGFLVLGFQCLRVLGFEKFRFEEAEKSGKRNKRGSRFQAFRLQGVRVSGI